FTVDVVYKSIEHKYIKSVKLNGENYEYSYIDHTAIMNGGSLVFEMTDQPTNWGTKDEFIPSTEIKEHLIVAAPFIEKGDIAFKSKTKVTLANVDKEASIFFRVGYKGGFKKYQQPFTIDKGIALSIYAEKNDVKSATIVTDFYKIDPNLKIELKTKYANQYNAGGNNALIDGITGTEDFRTGTWQGYWNEDVVAIVDLGQNKSISSIGVNFLRDQKSWVFLPTEVDFYVSDDGEKFQKINDWFAPKYFNTDEVEIEKVNVTQKLNTRYIKVVAKKLGVLPEWHLGNKHDGRSWVFIDEIQIR
ncbi:MAG: discoidin domain-containing protein, partial [Polaribacter sp.]